MAIYWSTPGCSPLRGTGENVLPAPALSNARQQRTKNQTKQRQRGRGCTWCSQTRHRTFKSLKIDSCVIFNTQSAAKAIKRAKRSWPNNKQKSQSLFFTLVNFYIVREMTKLTDAWPQRSYQLGRRANHQITSSCLKRTWGKTRSTEAEWTARAEMRGSGGGGRGESTIPGNRWSLPNYILTYSSPRRGTLPQVWVPSR